MPRFFHGRADNHSQKNPIEPILNRKHNIINTLSFKGNDLLLTFFVKHCPIVQIMWWSKHYIYQEPQFGIHWYKSDPLSIIWWNMTTNVMAASIGDNKTYLSISFFLLKCPQLPAHVTQSDTISCLSVGSVYPKMPQFSVKKIHEHIWFGALM